MSDPTIESRAPFLQEQLARGEVAAYEGHLVDDSQAPSRSDPQGTRKYPPRRPTTFDPNRLVDRELTPEAAREAKAFREQYPGEQDPVAEARRDQRRHGGTSKGAGGHRKRRI